MAHSESLGRGRIDDNEHNEVFWIESSFTNVKFEFFGYYREIEPVATKEETRKLRQRSLAKSQFSFSELSRIPYSN